jgi:phosphoenolpyruvate-protein kinase (PTS system EI component)
MGCVGAVAEAEELDIHVESTMLVPMVVGSHEASFVIDALVHHKKSFCRAKGLTVESLHVDFGVMISTPRACLHAHKIAKCDHLSTICFDLETLTQLVLGISENDCSSYMVRIRHL